MSEIETFTVGEIQVAEEEKYKQWHSGLSDQIPGLRYQEKQAPVVSLNGPTTQVLKLDPSDNIEDETDEEADKKDDDNDEGQVVQNGTQIQEEVEDQQKQDDFIIHKVGKVDSLIRLAVKYNVTVQDLKRVNNIVSELELYTKDSLLVPTEAMLQDKEMMIRAIKSSPGSGALVKQARAAKQDWETIKRNASTFDFPGDYLVDGTIFPINGTRHAGDVELSTFSSVVSQIRRVSLEASRAATHYFTDRSKQSIDQQQEVQQDAAPFRRSMSAPASRMRRQGIFSHTRNFGQSIGRGVVNLGRKVRDAVSSRGSGMARYNDLADDVITGQADFSDPSSDQQELGSIRKPNKPLQPHLTRLSKRSWGMRQELGN